LSAELRYRSIREGTGKRDRLHDDVMREIRNKAAHADVLTRDDAQRTRDWALRVLALV